jgi:hypothetical protein
MNRNQRREQQRKLRRRIDQALRESGCTCRYALIADADDRGGVHLHQRGCPLGDALDRRAAAGRPLLLEVVMSGCTR